MNKFEDSDTIICWRNVKDIDTGDYVDPDTSMQITIISQMGQEILPATDMTKDSIGHYHYDFQSGGHALLRYTVKYIAVDGTRKSTEVDEFELV